MDLISIPELVLLLIFRDKLILKVACCLVVSLSPFNLSLSSAYDQVVEHILLLSTLNSIIDIFKNIILRTLMTMASLPWADKPFHLGPTCKTLKPKASPDAIFIADGMANVHNSIIRCLNSMYQQAPYVSLPGDVKDLLLYAKFWLELVHHHHSREEDELFPAIAGISGKQGIMDVNIEQHRAFTGGMSGFEKYVKACIEGEPFEEKRFRYLIDGFGAELSKHLEDEILTLLALDIYDIKAVRKEYDNFDRKMRSGPKDQLYPLVMGCADRAYEGGNNFPNAPWFAVYVIHYWMERKHSSVWRFNPSTTWGDRRSLYFHA